MKKIILLLLFITLISCSAEEIKIPHSNTIIAGNVRNYDPDYPNIMAGVNRISFGQLQISSKIDPEGHFKFVFDSKIPTDVWLRYKANFLILTHPGDSMFVEFDGSKDNRYDLLKSIRFKGDFAKENAKAAKFQKDYFFLGYYFMKGKIYDYAEKYDHIKYKRFRDSIRIIENANLKRFIRKYNPTTETENWARSLLDLDYFRDMKSYPDHHQTVSKLNDESLRLPISYYDFIKDQFFINDSNLISGYAISSYVNLYPICLLEIEKARNKQIFESTEKMNKSHAIDSLIFFGTTNVEDPLLRQMVLTEILRQRLEQSQIDMFDHHEKTISEIVTRPFLKEPLFELYNQTINSINNPDHLSKLIYQNLSGKSVKSEMDKIIASNKGKVIYIDCWATWCGPCIEELPHYKKLIAQYKSKEVSFLFICLDSEKENWISIINKNSLEGQHIFLDKKQSQEFRESFNIEGLPHHVIIDGQGKIIENEPLSIEDKLDRLLTVKNNVP